MSLPFNHAYRAFINRALTSTHHVDTQVAVLRGKYADASSSLYACILVLIRVASITTGGVHRMAYQAAWDHGYHLGLTKEAVTRIVNVAEGLSDCDIVKLVNSAIAAGKETT